MSEGTEVVRKELKELKELKTSAMILTQQLFIAPQMEKSLHEKYSWLKNSDYITQQAT